MSEKGECFIWKKTERILFPIVLFLLCTGCGKESGEVKKTEAGKTRLAQFEDVAGSIWEDSWIAKTAHDQDAKISVHAIVQIPNVEKMSVAEVKEFVFDGPNKKMVAEGIFGNEVYSYDEEKLPRDVLEERLAEAREQREDYIWLKEGLERNPDNPDREEILEKYDKWSKEVERLSQLLESAGEDFTTAAAGDYQADHFIGKWNGMDYLLYFEDEASRLDQKVRKISFEPRNQDYIYPESLKGTKQKVTTREGDEVVAGKKRVGLDLGEYEKAKKTAEDFLVKAGFSDTVCQKECRLRWVATVSEESSENGTTMEDGYRFHYYTGANGEPFYSSKTNFPGYDQNFSLDTQIEIDVAASGVLRASWFSPITTISVTDNVKLLDFPDIQKIIRESVGSCITEKWAEDSAASPILYHLDRMRLEYFRLRDVSKPGYYSYVPVWALATGDHCLCMVNAIDGTVIDMKKELS